MPNEIQQLLERGVRLSLPLPDVDYTATLRYDAEQDLYYVQRPYGEGEQEFDQPAAAYADFQRVVGSI